MVFEFEPIPNEISTAITAILERKISSERREEVSTIALGLHKSFLNILRTAAREDDCIELFYSALSSLGYDKSLVLPRKAGMIPFAQSSHTFHAHFISRLGNLPQAANHPYDRQC